MAEAYGREYKLKAVRYCLETGAKATEACSKFDVVQSTLSKWIREYKETGDITEPRNSLPKNAAHREGRLSTCMETELADFAIRKAKAHNMSVSQYLRAIILHLYKQEKAKEVSA